MITIALDMMGGDNCPECNVLGAYDALKADKELKLLMVGPKELITESTAAWEDELKARAKIIDAPDVISTNEAPVSAVRRKKGSSIVVCANAVKCGDASAFVSAGSSGAVLAAGQLIVGRLKGVLRPPLASMIPSKNGFTFFLDLGANVDARPEWLLQFARMGSIYMEKVQGVSNPSVKLVNLGLEEEKGNALTKEANRLLKEAGDINYQGFIESREMMSGEADIIVADAFTGNAILKTIEGTVGFVMGNIKEVLKSGLLTKLAAMLIVRPLKERMKRFSASEQGGAMLLGLKGLVVKCHGNATRKDICNGILKAARYVKEDVTSAMAGAFAADSTDEAG